MIKKKTANKATGKKSKKKKGRARLKKETNPAAVRKQVSRIVEAEAVKITHAVVDEAMKGQLAPARYLFEMASIFPPQTNGEQATEEEDSLAKILLAKILLAKIEAPPKPEQDGENEVNPAEEEENPPATTAVESDGEGAQKADGPAPVKPSASMT